MNRTEPIRKPFDKQTRKIKQHRRIARSIDGRIVASLGKLYLVSRAPTFDLLVTLISKLTPENYQHNSAVLNEIAFAGGCDGQLTEGVLNSIHRSIARWKNDLVPLRSRAAKNEIREASRLEKRAKFCGSVLNPFSSSFLLDPNQEERLTRIMVHPKCKALTEFEKFLARIIYWFGGNISVKRFVEALNPPCVFESQKIQQIDSMLAWLKTLQRRSESEPLWLLNHEFRKSKKFQKTIRWAKKVNYEWTSVQGTFPEKLQTAIDNFEHIRRSMVELVGATLPTTIAAWVICDHGTGPLPQTEIALTRFRFRHALLKSTAASFVAVSDQPAYDRWLNMIDTGKFFSCHEELFAILRMLNCGASVNDCLYVSSSVGASWVGNDVDIKKAKRLIEQIRRLMNQPGGALESKLHRLFFSNQAMQIGEIIFGWLNSFPEGAISDRAIKIVLSLIEDAGGMLNSSIFGPMIVARIKLWSNRQQSRHDAVDNESQWPPLARQWVRRLGYYQRLAGEASRVPKSLQCLLAFDEKRTKEMAFLQAQADAGTITRLQEIRLIHLSSYPSEPNKTKLSRYVRSAQDVCLLTGLDALRQVFVDVAKEVWHRVANEGNENWSLARWVAMAQWTCNMSPQEKRLFRQTLQAWKEYGRNYKRYLPFNQVWLRDARQRVSNPRQWRPRNWLNAMPYATKVNDQRVNFEVVVDPVETYQMGTYFNTCLSQGGCYEMSVLPNAAEANKQVVFATNKRGDVVARQLLSISEDFKIVGYYIYMNLKDTGIDRESLEGEFQSYANQIARQSGLELCFEDEPPVPENLSKVSWYDDEVVSWEK